MINSDDFAQRLAERVGMVAGVPDSLLASLCASLERVLEPDRFRITANEGSAVALVAGAYLASGRPGAVFLQNSGLPHALNPVLSLCDTKVCGLPVLLFVGWRGEPGVPDEPQHARQGEVTEAMLSSAGVTWCILPTEELEAHQALDEALEYMKRTLSPYAFIVRKKTFTALSHIENAVSKWPRREDALHAVLEHIPETAAVVSTTGMLSRELHELRMMAGETHEQDFLCIGAMGHASQIALGLALTSAKHEVFCLDGDGAALMHLGGWATIGTSGRTGIRHIVFNNIAHDSVGGFSTVADRIDLCAVARACGYAHAEPVETLDGIKSGIEAMRAAPGPAMLELRIAKGARSDLGRPNRSPAQNREDFMAFLAGRLGHTQPD